MSSNFQTAVLSQAQATDEFLESWLSTVDKVVEKHSHFDVLAGSQALYRLFDGDITAQGSRGYKRWMDFHDSDLPGLITQEDMVAARNIREYYAKQLIVSSLQSERPFSKYMSQLAGIVNSNGSVYTNENIGIIYRLPEYYAYDTSWDAMIDQHFKDVPQINSKESSDFRVLPVTKLVRRNRSERTTELWCSNVETRQPVCLQLQMSNSLGYIAEYLFNKGKEISITMPRASVTERRGSSFLMSDKWKITNLESL